jgi:hypothetical protein
MERDMDSGILDAAERRARDRHSLVDTSVLVHGGTLTAEAYSDGPSHFLFVRVDNMKLAVVMKPADADAYAAAINAVTERLQRAGKPNIPHEGFVA